MKKFNKFGYASAMLLATAMGFTGCSSDDEMENINPTYDGSSVKTQFSISLTQKANKGGRMSSAEVGIGEFQGINNIKLYHLASEPNADAHTEGIVSNITEINGFNYQNTANTKLNGNVYDIKIPTGTSHFLFYGESKVSSNGETLATYPASALFARVDAIKFTPSKILSGENATAFGTAYAGIVTVLNNVYAALTANGLPASVKAEASTLAQLKTASSDHILALVEDIYNSIVVQAASLPNNAEGKSVIEGALTAIENAGFTKLGDSAPYSLSWATDPEFPTKYNLPSGAVTVKFENSMFAKADGTSNTADGSQSDFNMYAKPAKLMYFANSTTSVRNTSYFDMVAQTPVANASESDWAALAANFTEGRVAETTRSVIMTKPVNYAVAQLQTKVQFTEEEILDSKRAVVEIPSGGFKVTGILIGNQKEVDWEFKPTGTNIYTIYDGAMASVDMYAKQKTNAATDNYSDVNYTLVYETQAAQNADDHESDVFVALELVNGANDFYGVEGQKVPAGAKFYITGVLHVGDKYSDAEDAVNSVFKQDYITTANFTISSLAGAYNTIPDLATPSMEFGMSVDLEWKTGLNFDVTIQ